jgi:hypothetical protein
MATAAETTAIIQLVVGMVDAAPGADILLELEDIIDSGLTIEELAVAIAENPAFSGDTGLFPDYLPNAIFAENFLTQLLGDEVTAEALAASIVEMTASLNAGDSRGAAMNASIDALAASTDPDFADAAAALANKTEVAEYYSVTIAQSSESLDDLIAVVSAVDSSETAVADGTAAADVVAAGLVPLVANLNVLADAQTAQAANLLAEGQDPATEAADPATTTAALLGLYAGALGAVGAVVDLGYAAATPAVQAAQLAAAEAVLQAAVDVEQDLLDDLNDDIDAVAGLAAAAAALIAADTGLLAAGASLGLDDIALGAAETSYNLLATAVKDIVTVNGGALGLGATVVTVESDDGVDPYELINTSTAGALKLAFGITEETHPGITAILAAYVSNNAAIKALDTATTTQATAELKAQLLDTDVSADIERNDLGLLITTVADVDFPTQAEIAAQLAILQTAESNGRAALIADIADVTHTGLAGGDIAASGDVAALLATAVTALLISAADEASIQGAFDAELSLDNDLLLDAAIAAAGDDIDATAAGSEATSDLTVFVDTYNLYEAAEIAANPLLTDLDALVNVTIGTLTVAQADVDDLADRVADQNETAGAWLGQVALDTAVTAAIAVLAAEDQVVSTVVDDLIATEDNDVYLLGTAGGDITDFGTDGDDAIFIGLETYVLNTVDDSDEGDDAVLEIFLSESTGGDTTITIETSVFGGSAAEPEVIEVVLVGVSAADIVLDGGLLTVA